MKRLFSVFTAIIILLSVTCVVLLYQNSGLNNQIGVLEDELDVYQIQSIEYENEISVLENQILELESQIDDLENQNLELETEVSNLEAQIENSTDLVMITELLKYGWYNPAGLTMISTVNVTIKNFGINTVSGLSLLIEDFSDWEVTEDWGDNVTIQIKPINPREIRTISRQLQWGLGSKGYTTATLMLGNEIIDNYTIFR